MSYYNQNTATEKWLFFDLSESGTGYKGYVEVCMSIGAIEEYNFNALIDGLEDTGGDYSPLVRVF